VGGAAASPTLLRKARITSGRVMTAICCMREWHRGQARTSAANILASYCTSPSGCGRQDPTALLITYSMSSGELLHRLGLLLDRVEHPSTVMPAAAAATAEASVPRPVLNGGQTDTQTHGDLGAAQFPHLAQRVPQRLESPTSPGSANGGGVEVSVQGFGRSEGQGRPSDAA
jgi:hypothetical protein